MADELHLEVSAVGAPAEAHARMAYALAELKKYLTPDNMDYISIEQLEELERMRESNNYTYNGKLVQLVFVTFFFTREQNIVIYKKHILLIV